MVPDVGGRTINVVVKNKQGVLFEGLAKAITSINEGGVFDILPLHENFISVVKDFIRIHKADDKITDLKITTGVVRAIQNKVNVYVGFET